MKSLLYWIVVFFDRLAYIFYVVCFITSVVMTIFMFMAGAVGGACGENKNFTEILSKTLLIIIIAFIMVVFVTLAYVIDNQDTWEGKYPLAEMVLGNPDYPLGYQEVLTGCRHGNNIHTVLDPEQNFSIANYHPVSTALVTVRIVYIQLLYPI